MADQLRLQRIRCRIDVIGDHPHACNSRGYVGSIIAATLPFGTGWVPIQARRIARTSKGDGCASHIGNKFKGRSIGIAEKDQVTLLNRSGSPGKGET